jgi:hypothetical protein
MQDQIVQFLETRPEGATPKEIGFALQTRGVLDYLRGLKQGGRVVRAESFDENGVRVVRYYAPQFAPANAGQVSRAFEDES